MLVAVRAVCLGVDGQSWRRKVEGEGGCKVEAFPFHFIQGILMKLFTKTIEQKLLANGRNRDQDHAPVVKIFNPMGSATWLINEMDSETPDLLHGLC